jgi:hypothetical protein
LPVGLVTWEGFDEVSQVTRNVPPAVHTEVLVGHMILGTQTSRFTRETGAENAQERSARSMKKYERKRGVFMYMMSREESLNWGKDTKGEVAGDDAELSV